MRVDIVGEDYVTRAIILRLIKEYRTDLVINNIRPVRGGEIKSKAPLYNNTGLPIFMLTDLDTYACPPSLISDWFGNSFLNENLLFRIAYGEAETWLMADREGFSKWLQIDIDKIPLPQNIDSDITEIVFPYKPSLFLMKDLAAHSLNNELKEGLCPVTRAKKGPLYNGLIMDFIENKWDIEKASRNSTSLEKTIERLKSKSFN